VPGIDVDKLDLNVKENILTISGEYNYGAWPQTTQVATETENSQQTKPQFRTLVNEIAQGKFVRQFKLAVPFDADKIEAHYDNGLLKLTLPKSERHQPKRITVNQVSRAQ
jgi:HSP20 family protein